MFLSHIHVHVPCADLEGGGCQGGPDPPPAKFKFLKIYIIKLPKASDSPGKHK